MQEERAVQERPSAPASLAFQVRTQELPGFRSPAACAPQTSFKKVDHARTKAEGIGQLEAPSIRSCAVALAAHFDVKGSTRRQQRAKMMFQAIFLRPFMISRVKPIDRAIPSTPCGDGSIRLVSIRNMVPRGGIEPPTRGFSIFPGVFSNHFKQRQAVAQPHGKTEETGDFGSSGLLISHHSNSS